LTGQVKTGKEHEAQLEKTGFKPVQLEKNRFKLAQPGKAA
jgi:hypothetical protein